MSPRAISRISILPWRFVIDPAARPIDDCRRCSALLEDLRRDDYRISAGCSGRVVGNVRRPKSAFRVPPPSSKG
jgi:hypothetical protein